MARLVVNRDRFVERARPTGYLLVNSFLSQYGIVRAALALPPAKVLVFLTIVAATVQKLMRKSELPADLNGTAPVPRAMWGYISRRSIAASTGLPRENVRRIVNELLLQDWLITDSRGAVANANRGQLMSRPEVLDGLEQLVREIAQVAEKLIEAGVIEIKPNEQDQTKGNEIADAPAPSNSYSVKAT
jgi:hypothetical protein